MWHDWPFRDDACLHSNRPKAYITHGFCLNLMFCWQFGRFWRSFMFMFVSCSQAELKFHMQLHVNKRVMRFLLLSSSDLFVSLLDLTSERGSVRPCQTIFDRWFLLKVLSLRGVLTQWGTAQEFTRGIRNHKKNVYFNRFTCAYAMRKLSKTVSIY